MMMMMILIDDADDDDTLINMTYTIRIDIERGW